MQLFYVTGFLLSLFAAQLSASHEENIDLDPNFSCSDLFSEIVETNDSKPSKRKEAPRKNQKNSNKKAKKGDTWFDNFSEKKVLIKFRNSEDLYVLEAHIEMIINGKSNAKVKERKIQRHIDNNAKKYPKQTLSLASNKEEDIWDALNLESGKSFKKFRIINVEAFEKNGILYNYSIKSQGKLVREIWEENKENFKKIELACDLPSEEN